MPRYVFVEKNTGEERIEYLSVSERDTFLAENPNYFQPLAIPSQGDSVRLGVTKPDKSFTDLMKNIGRNNLHSTIQT